MANYEVEIDADSLSGVSSGPLRQHVDKIVRLKEDAKKVRDEIAAEYATAQAEGFDKKVLRVLVKRLESDPDALAELDELLRLYEAAYRFGGGAQVKADTDRARSYDA
jgi:uncharacterized protein (UPF0335 family)